jgi:hypothetical protein
MLRTNRWLSVYMEFSFSLRSRYRPSTEKKGEDEASCLVWF